MVFVKEGRGGNLRPSFCSVRGEELRVTSAAAAGNLDQECQSNVMPWLKKQVLDIGWQLGYIAK